MTIEGPPLYLQGGTYPARLDRFQIAYNHTEGVADALACKVAQRGAGANFTVDIATGTFWIAGDDQTNQGTYQGRITATENATISAAPGGSNQRYDLVTLRVNDPNAGGNTGNTVTVVVVAGTPSTTPAVPALPASSLPLAVIGPITSSTASITNSIITDVWTGGGPTFAASCRRLSDDWATPGALKLRAVGADSVSGWMWCNGAAVSRSTYSALYAMLGTTFGAGDGSTTFNLPDLRDRMPVAYGVNFPTLAGTGGEINHTLTTGEMPSHNHGATTGNESANHTHAFSGTTTTDGAHVHTINGRTVQDGTGAGAYTYQAGGQLADGVQSAGSHSHTVSGDTTTESVAHAHAVSSDGGGGAHNNMPPYQVVSGWMIKY